MITGILLDALCAAVAGTGFGMISNPPRRLLFVAGALAACGHALRFWLATGPAQWGIASATLAGAFVIGMGGFVAGRISGCPSEIFSFPALLPFVPGLKAYYAVLALLKFLRCGDDVAAAQRFIGEFFENGLAAVFVLLAIVVGAAFSLFADTLSSRRDTRRLRLFRRKNSPAVSD
ncbi:MAG: threonine/serine exporter family protein [Candidatus Spyradosoma sp.]